jgi:hypothetical protein
MTTHPMFVPFTVAAAVFAAAALTFSPGADRGVTGGHPFVQVAAGDSHSVGLAQDGAVWAWGRDDRLASVATPSPARVGESAPRGVASSLAP